MSVRGLNVLALVAAILALSSQRLAAQKAEQGKVSEKVAKAKKALQEHVDEVKARGGQIVHLDSPALFKELPDQVFFALRFRQFPVARVLPKGMKASNLFAVSKEGKVLHVKDAKALEKFFRDKLPAVVKQPQVENALASWLALAQEFHQDGFFKFEILTKGFAAEEKGNGNWEGAGRALVTQGGNGELNVTLVFQDNKLAKVTHSSKIRPGPRPICQATKLLHADPIVRRMAEQDLLFIGLAARDYLMEQRAQASPPLRQAIDRLWQRIVREAP